MCIYINIDRCKNLEKPRYRISYVTIYINLKKTHTEQHNAICCLPRLINVYESMKKNWGGPCQYMKVLSKMEFSP